MTVYRASRITTYAVILTGASALALATGSYLFLALTALACVLNWHTEESRQPWRLRQRAASLLTVAAFAVMLVFLAGSGADTVLAVLELRVPMIASFLLVVQWVMLFRKKTCPDMAWIYAISLVHLAATALLLPEIQFAAAFLVFAGVGVCALTLLHFRFETERCGPDSAIAVAERVAPAALIRRRFFVKGAVAAVLLTFPVALIFAFLPRAGRGSLAHLAVRSPTPLTGFSERVALGDIAQIQEDDTKVMQVVVHTE